MTMQELLALLVVVVAAPLNWIVATWLWRLSLRAPERWTLRANAVMATGLALIVTVFAIVFVNNGMAAPVLSNVQTQLVTRSTLLVLSVVPAVYWIRLYRRS